MKFPERVRVATTGVGTGPLTMVATAVSAEFQTVMAAGLVVGDTFTYSVGLAGSAEWECGVATITTISNGTATFSRTPTASSNGNAAVNFSAGTKEVVATPLGATLTKWENGTSTRLVFASSLCASDSTLGMTPGVGANQAAKAQALLDLAANGPLTLLWDVACSLGSTLRVRSNTTIKALPNCGAVMLAASNVPMWRNYNPTKSPGAIIDQNIRFEGGIWHGNLGTMTANDQVTLFDFYGVNTISAGGEIEFRKPAGFAFRVTNGVRITVDGYVVDHGVGNTLVSTDGIHINGPASHIRIARGRHYNGADDGIALNADDGWGAITPGPLDGSYGPITDVTIEDIEFQTYVCGVRLLSGGSLIDNVSISNIKGKTGAYTFIADNFNPAQTQQTGPGNIGTVRLSNVATENVPVSGWGKMAVHLNCKIGQFIFENVTKNKLNNELFPALRIGEKADIGQLVIDKYISRPSNGATYLTKQIHFVAGSKVGQVVLSNSAFYAPSAVSGCPIVVESGATIDQMVLSGNIGRNFTDFVENNGTIGNFIAPAASNSMTTPAVPTGWVTQSGTPWGASTDSSAITYNGPVPGVIASAKQAANDTFYGNVKVKARLRFATHTTVTQHAAILVRGSSLVPYSGVKNFIGMDIALNQSGGGAVKSLKSVNGVQSNISQEMSVGANLATATDYDIEFNVKSSSASQHQVDIYIQRVSDQKWLKYDNTWSDTKVPARGDAHADANLPPVSGEVGVYAYDEGDSQHTGDGVTPTISFSNFTVAAAS
ncbi:hypothetical protein [Massilia phyllosphaerae]|uniref:hypothetical protein n=1 Tax=Massilia phyllosphaerae TaxID=3106034 RepID=UPI002B1CE22F|nr:hypothetical protein [Massilia sp. SGZ-792]